MRTRMIILVLILVIVLILVLIDEDKDEDGDVPIRLGSLMLLSDQHLLSDKMRASSYQL